MANCGSIKIRARQDNEMDFNRLNSAQQPTAIILSRKVCQIKAHFSHLPHRIAPLLQRLGRLTKLTKEKFILI